MSAINQAVLAGRLNQTTINYLHFRAIRTIKRHCSSERS